MLISKAEYMYFALSVTSPFTTVNNLELCS